MGRPPGYVRFGWGRRLQGETFPWEDLARDYGPPWGPA